MIPATVLARIDSYWAAYLGCDVAQLQKDEPTLLSHSAALSDYAGIYIVQRRGFAPVLSLPAGLVADLGAPLAAAASEALVADGRWEAIVAERLERLVGPAWLGYAAAETLRSVGPAVDVHELPTSSTPDVEALRSACSPAEWENLASLRDAAVVVGAFAGSELAAVANYQVWADTFAHIGVVTAPAYRGRGLARAAVSRLSRIALEQGLIPQYRSLMANTASAECSQCAWVRALWHQPLSKTSPRIAGATLRSSGSFEQFVVARTSPYA